ncbi:unnamed protein product [Effrenium voratum]|uniref:WW domain-containing protein n=1 Tax=Effrenium voratum TaxID=2562239 RepID=A0AA36JB05_9DINO|nr:unnamed protein product [Effrenium voratum]
MQAWRARMQKFMPQLQKETDMKKNDAMAIVNENSKLQISDLPAEYHKAIAKLKQYEEEADQLVELWRQRKERKSSASANGELLRAAEARAEEARAEEERQRLEKEEQQERARLEELQRQQEEEERLHKEAKVQERKARVEEFLQANGFTEVAAPKRVQEKMLGVPLMSKTIYAIHVAAELGDADMVEMLMKEGADPMQKTSAGKTPKDLAKKRSKGGSHDAVIQALGQKTAKIGGAYLEADWASIHPAETAETGRMALPPNWTKYSTDDGKEYYYNSATNVTQWEKPEWSLGPESASFHSQSSEVYRPSVSDLDLQDRAAPTGGGMVPLGGHEARGGKLATTEADTVSLNVPSGAMDSVQGPAAGGSLRGFGGMIASAAGAEEGQDVQGWAGAMLSYAQQMFDVSSQDVLKRIKLALVPFQGQEDAANDFRTRPDFYGPFWVASTAILFLAATGNFARLLEMEDEQDFKSDYKLVSVAATLIYGLLVAVPLAVRLGLYCSGQSVDSINFKQVICVYGYSSTPLIPMSVICLVPLGFLRWLAVLGGLGTSLAFIYGTLWTDLAVEAPSLKWKVLGLCCAAHASRSNVGVA